MVNKKRRLFDAEYTIRFGLMCVVAISVMVLVFNYEYASNEIVSLNKSNERDFLEKFEELKLESEWGTYMDIDGVGQRKISVVNVDRENYDISPRVFVKLPFIPYDFSKIKYAFDNGYYSVLAKATSDYYLQPEFYDDWRTVGMAFHNDENKGCKAGFFSLPSGQRLYTEPGSTIETFMLVHSSFCVGNPQGVSFEAVYPKSGVTDDGVEYVQDPDVVRRFITLGFDPSKTVLGSTYPRFEKDWVDKVKVEVSVSYSAPSGVYVVAVNSTGYESFVDNKDNINKEAYISKGGSPLMYLVISVE